MKPIREYIDRPAGQSLRIRRRIWRRCQFVWHHHPEYELTWIRRGSGLRYVGDRVEPFHGPEVVLLGPDVPHSWYSQVAGEAWVIQFDRGWIAPVLQHWPELLEAGRLLERSSCGWVWKGVRAMRVMEDAHPSLRRGGLAALTGVLHMLGELAGQAENRRLTTSGYVPRGRKIPPPVAWACRHVHEHLHDCQSLTEIARRWEMSPASFSRSFRRAMGRTFIDFVHEVRVGEAARLLSATPQPILRIALAAGFNNLAHFNRVFRRLRRMTPSAYRRRFFHPPYQPGA